jgi:hypothetical protein
VKSVIKERKSSCSSENTTMENKEKMDTDSIVVKPEYASSEFSTEGPPVSYSQIFFFTLQVTFWVRAGAHDHAGKQSEKQLFHLAHFETISWAISCCLPF